MQGFFVELKKIANPILLDYAIKSHNILPIGFIYENTVYAYDKGQQDIISIENIDADVKVTPWGVYIDGVYIPTPPSVWGVKLGIDYISKYSPKSLPSTLASNELWAYRYIYENRNAFTESELSDLFFLIQLYFARNITTWLTGFDPYCASSPHGVTYLPFIRNIIRMIDFLSYSYYPISPESHIISTTHTADIIIYDDGFQTLEEFESKRYIPFCIEDIAKKFTINFPKIILEDDIGLCNNVKDDCPPSFTHTPTIFVNGYTDTFLHRRFALPSLHRVSVNYYFLPNSLKKYLKDGFCKFSSDSWIQSDFSSFKERLGDLEGFVRAYTKHIAVILHVTELAIHPLYS